MRLNGTVVSRRMKLRAATVAIIPTVDRLAAKGGREIFCRCPTAADADTTAAWLIDRISRLEPGLTLTSDIQEGGGQYLVALRA